MHPEEWTCSWMMNRDASQLNKPIAINLRTRAISKKLKIYASRQSPQPLYSVLLAKYIFVKTYLSRVMNGKGLKQPQRRCSTNLRART